MAADHGISYADALQVQRALDWAEPAQRTPQILRALESATRSVEGLCNRTFYPLTATLPYDYPNPQRALPWRLWLDDHQLVSVTTLKVGPNTIAAADYYLRPYWGPPYSHLELNRSTVGGFSSAGAVSPQKQILITGVWGYDLQEDPAGTLAAGCTAAATTITVTDASTLAAGALIRVGTERMAVTGRAMTSTGVTAGTALTASAASNTVLFVSGLNIGETILIDSERILITDMVGTTATVRRAVDATVLASHGLFASINAPRLLTVTRGALGTTAAAHTLADPVVRHVYPGSVIALTVAETILKLTQELRGFTVSRQGTNQGDIPEVAGIADLRDQVYTTYGRKNRARAV